MTERVSLELIKLIFDYIKKDKEIDRPYLDKLIEIGVSNLSLNDYVKKLVIDDSMPKGDDIVEAGAYNFGQKTIYIYQQSLLDFLKSGLPYLVFSNIDKKTYFYTSVAQTVFHELSHAAHFKKIKESEEDFETKLLKVCYRPYLLAEENTHQAFQEIITDMDPKMINHLSNQEENFKDVLETYLKRKNDLYKKLYQYAPHERLAEDASIKTILSSISKVKLFTNIENYWIYKLYTNYLRGYSTTVMNPTKYYLEQFGNETIIKGHEKNTPNLSLTRRLTLGLEINKAERYTYLSKIDELGDIILY